MAIKQKTAKTRDLVIKELREIFAVKDNIDCGRTEANGKFRIHKQQMGRFEVINMLKNYFNDVYVEDGYVIIGSITFVHTTFDVCKNSIS